MVDNLEYLVRGGRVSKIGGLLGNILQLKPILHVSQGEIALFDRVRTAPKAIKKVLEEIDKKKNELEKIAVIHVDAPEEAIALKKIVEASYSLPIVVSEVGPVIGTHAGPGALGLAFY
jgi:DegV family protein with EDD domain